MTPLTPPRWSERIVKWSLPLEDRFAVLGDLQEEFAAIASASGEAAARRWYRKQAFVSLIPNILRHINADIRRENPLRVLRAWALLIAAFVGMCGPIGLVFWAAGDPDFLIGIGAGAVLMTAFFCICVLLLIVWPRRADGTRRGPAMRRPSGWRAATIWGTFIVLDGMQAIVGHGPSPAIGTLALTGALLVWFWPSRKVPAAIAEYSVRTPAIAMGRESNGNIYLLTTVSEAPLAMSEPLVGIVAPVQIPDEDRIDGVTPMKPTIERTFSHRDSVRLAAAVNLKAGPASGRLDVLNSQNSIVKTVAAALTPATLQRPVRRVFAGVNEPPIDDSKAPPIGQLDITLPLIDLAPGKYCLRLSAVDAVATSHQDTEIEVR